MTDDKLMVFTPVSHWFERSPLCICGPDLTGEAPDERPDCSQHGSHLGADLPADAEPPF
jgi:hypothetical protein